MSTKREAVDLALRRLVGEPLSREFLRDLRGSGWGTDDGLSEVRPAQDVAPL